MSAVMQQHKHDVAELVREHQSGVWRYMRYLGATVVEAEDLVQETFLAFIRAKFNYRSSRETAAFLRKVARNQLLQLRRKQGHQINTVELEAAESVWGEVAAEDGLNDYLFALEDCLKQLSGRPREAVELQYKQGLDRIQVAKRLKMSVEGVKTMLRRARRSLRDCVQRKVNQL